MMNALQKKRLWMVSTISLVLVLIVSLVSFALRQNISLYYTPEQIARHEAPTLKFIRVGGMVMQSSLVHYQDPLDIDFMVTDYKANLKVHYHGLLPDLFREGQGIVVKGKLKSDDLFEATEVLAKHDEKYMPPEVKSSLDARGITS
jgi:cytochrome c-type biogenesis protein CcmE